MVNGFTTLIVRVISVDSVSKKAVVLDGRGQTHEVRIDVMPTRTESPIEGETWIIDRSLGFWSFVGIVNPPGGSPPDVVALQTSVAALQASVTALQAALAGLLAGPGTAPTAAHSDILTAAGALLLNQTYAADFFVPAADFGAALGTPTYASFGGWATTQWGWHFANAAQSGVIGHAYLPSNYSVGTTVSGDILFTCATGGALKIDGQFAAIRPGTDPMNTTGGIPPGHSNVVGPSGNEDLILLGAGTASGTPAPGCLLNIAVDRDGTNAFDTNPNTMTFHGVRIRYTAVRI
jgi:hypothetical protein